MLAGGGGGKKAPRIRFGIIYGLKTEVMRWFPHPYCDGVVRYGFQVRQRGSALGHPVQLIYGGPQPSSGHGMRR